MSSFFRTPFSALRTAIGRGPAMVQDRARPFSLAFDGLWIPRAGSAYFTGWMWDPSDSLGDLTLVVPGEGPEIPLKGRMMPAPRPDVMEHLNREFQELTSGRLGFVCCVSHPSIELTPESFQLRARFTDGSERAVSRRVTEPETGFSVSRLLAIVAEGCDANDQKTFALMEEAMRSMSASRSGKSRIQKAVSFGVPPSKPAVSVIVPLFREVALFRAQVASLCGDPYRKSCEFIFVVDSPETAAEFERAAYELYTLHDFSMKVVILEQNYGFASANNLGVEHAKGDHLLFLNSDVFPIRDGWLREMRDFYDAQDSIGPLGAKLLYEDDTLQHAGMYFAKESPPGKLWENRHYFRGLPRDHPPASGTRRAPAVTGACLLMRRDRFEVLEGWDESYFLNFEDSDLCIRAQRKGLDSWYLGSTELRHLEGRSLELVERTHGNYCACWLQTMRWDSEIREIMGRFESDPT